MTTQSSSRASDYPAQTRLGELMLLCAVFIWGVNVVVLKIALREFSPQIFNTLRFIIAAGISWAILRYQRHVTGIQSRDCWKFIWMGLIGHTLYQFLFLFGVSLTTAGNTALLSATSPLWLTLLASMFGLDRLRSTQWLGLGLSFIGLLVVIAGGGKTFTLGAGLTGDALVLASVVVGAFYSMLIKRMMVRYSPVEINAYTMTSGALGMLLLSIPSFVAQDFSVISTRAWVLMVCSAVVSIAFAYFAWNYGLQRQGPARAALYSNLQPLFALMASAIALSEPIGWVQVAGAVFILGGIGVSRMRGVSCSVDAGIARSNAAR